MSQLREMKDQKNPILWREAFAAFGRLRKDPDETKEVFVIIRALTGNSFVRMYNKFIRTEHGQRVIGERRSMIDFLQDRTPLKALPVGTLGHTYDAFMTHEGLSADGLAQASDEGNELSSRPNMDRDANLEVFGNWNRDIHDLFHISSGYGRDELGELCLLAFTYQQTRNPGIGFIVFMGTLLSLRQGVKLPIIKCVREALRNGRKAAWLPQQDWEAMLDMPLDEVRAKLNIRWPQAYHDAIKQARAMDVDPRIGRGRSEGALVEKNKIMDEAFVPIAPELAAH